MSSGRSTDKSPKILLLSAYDAASHQHWRNTLVAGLPQFDWSILTLPARHFYWRVRSNALTFASRHRDVLSDDYDLVLATSMVDIATLRGLVPSLARSPLLVYCHENQFVYPLEKPSSNIVYAQLTSIMSCFCADRVLFNSDYNRRSFLSGASALLKRMPDGVEAVDSALLPGKSAVLPVPITVDPVVSAHRNTPIEIIWNHRWEYDKQPEVFLAALRKLKQAKVAFVVHVVGQSFRQVPDCFAAAREEFAAEIGIWGYQERKAYETLLARADIAVSTALHDFQGLSLLEAITCGCLPVAPDRVAYPEYVPAVYRYRVTSKRQTTSAGQSLDAIDLESTALCETLISVLQGTDERPDVSQYQWSALEERYHSLLMETIALSYKTPRRI